MTDVDWTNGRIRMLFYELLTAASADWIRTMRVRRGSNQAELARRVGMQRPIYSRVESGRHLVTLQTLERLAWVFGVPIAEVLPGGAEPWGLRTVMSDSGRRRAGEPFARVRVESRVAS